MVAKNPSFLDIFFFDPFLYTRYSASLQKRRVPLSQSQSQSHSFFFIFSYFI